MLLVEQLTLLEWAPQSESPEPATPRAEPVPSARSKLVTNDRGPDRNSTQLSESKRLREYTDVVVKFCREICRKAVACGEKFRVKADRSYIDLVIVKGKVSTATVEGELAGTPAANCVEKAAKSVKCPSTLSTTSRHVPFEWDEAFLCF